MVACLIVDVAGMIVRGSWDASTEPIIATIGGTVIGGANKGASGVGAAGEGA
jgi:hypothetical protein